MAKEQCKPSRTWRRSCEQRQLEYAYNPGALKVTIKKFYRAAGVSTQLKGVVSDIELPSIWNYATDEVGESSLPNALPCDEVPSDDPVNLNRVSPYLAELQQLSKQRLATDRDFALHPGGHRRFSSRTRPTRASPSTKPGALAEQKARKERAEARKKERLSRKKSDEKVFEITMKNVDLAQLQPPVVKTNSVAAASEPVFDDEDRRGRRLAAHQRVRRR